MKNKHLFYNTVSSFTFQIVTIICGFILPRIILKEYGSEVNGLINSISQLLGFISFLQMGVGAVVQSSLYKPLADKNEEQVSKVIASANKFFHLIAKVFFLYVVSLVFIYPLLTKSKFEFWYTALLIIIISAGTFAQYLFGIVNRILLSADQKGYIQFNAQTIAVVLNTVVCALLIYCGFNIHIVKTVTSTIYVLQPFIIHIYVKRYYNINSKMKYEGEPITQKWNGFAQHMAAVILDDTDGVVLTFFATLSDVSIYSVYNLVVKGIKQLLLSMTNGIQALLGNLWARQELEELKKTFEWTEWVIHTFTVLIFGIAATLIVPFIMVYTNGINDADYYQPVFAALIVLANAGHCLRLPYNLMILAAGHYKQTQSNYIIASILNVGFSIATVKIWGLVGVAIGTLIAMGYQTIWMARYNSKNFVNWPIKNFIKQILIDAFIVVFAVPCCSFLSLGSIKYSSWIVLALEESAIWIGISILVNICFYKNKVFSVGRKIKAVILKR